MRLVDETDRQTDQWINKKQTGSKMNINILIAFYCIVIFMLQYINHPFDPTH